MNNDFLVNVLNQSKINDKTPLFLSNEITWLCISVVDAANILYDKHTYKQTHTNR